jgi:ubiquinone/menaquinone biosynthesis C-methylase UbiE
MNRITAFIKSFRWTFKFFVDLQTELFQLKNNTADALLTRARSKAITNQLKRLASTGGNAFYAFHSFRQIQEMCLKHNHVPKKVLEIGTGSNLGILTLFLMSTAEKAYGVDIEPLDVHYDEDIYNSLQEYLSATGGFTWYLHAFEHKPIPHLSFPTSMSRVDFKKLVNQIEYFAPCGSDNIPLADNSLDLFYSIATMEHLPKTKETIQEMKRLLVNGGLAVHEIDMSYHRSHPNPLEMLKHSEEDWQKITNQYGSGVGVDDIWQGKFKGEIYCNRLRTSDFVDLFNESGFEILEITPTATFDPKHININLLDKKFANKTLDDLSVTMVRIVARCKK